MHYVATQASIFGSLNPLTSHFGDLVDFKALLKTSFILGALILSNHLFAAEVAETKSLSGAPLSPSPVLTTGLKRQLQQSVATWSRLWDIAGTDENGLAWIEGETLRLLFSEFLDTNTGPLTQLLTELRGVRLSRDNEQLYISLIYDHPFMIQIREFKNSPDWQLYSVSVPEVSKFSIRMSDGVLQVTQLYQKGQSWTLGVKMPLLPDEIYLHRTSLDLVTGEGRVDAGFLKDLVAIVAATRLQETNLTFVGIQFWESILETLRFAPRVWDPEVKRSKPKVVEVEDPNHDDPTSYRF